MRTKLITAVAVTAVLAGGGLALAQGGEGGRDTGAAPAGHERGPGGGMGHEGGAKAGGERTGQGAEKAGGGRMGQGGAEKAGNEKAGGGEKAKIGAGETGHDERKADKGDKADRGDRADTGGRGDRDHADRDRDDHGDRDRDRADRENVHVNIRVGGGVPEGRRLAPLKTTLVERYPQYRGFEMYVEDDEIVIVDPGTRKIVRTVSEGEAGMNHAASTDCR